MKNQQVSKASEPAAEGIKGVLEKSKASKSKKKVEKERHGESAPNCGIRGCRGAMDRHDPKDFE